MKAMKAMRAEDLMIGDWVRIIDDDTDAHFDARIEGIDVLANIYATMPCDETAYPYSVDCAQPIPLTPEILEKNGFKKIESETTSLAENWRWHEKVTGRVYNRYVGITFYKEPINGVSHLTKIETCSQKGDGVDQIHSCDIDYIHELQHALRICGITKEIQI